ncbi:MAG: carbon monoxide dehydrogenase [bacterium]
MAEFDEQILAVRKFVRNLQREGKNSREIRCPGAPEELLRDLPVRFSPEGSPFVILKEETFVELGNPIQGSASTVLWTRQTELVRDGAVTWIGPDIPETAGQSRPFGQVILVGGSRLPDADLARVERAKDLAHQLEGYMIRHLPRKLWSRVSKEAVARGFSFETLGRALMARYKSEIPLVEAVEIVFVTTSKGDVEELDQIARDAQGKSLSIRKLTRAQDGAYECDELTCDTCPEKPTCDTIRDVLVIRRKGKITGIRIVREPRSP